MKNYTIELELKSVALAESGVGFGSGIDTDVMFDDFGLPYITAKRIKGCLRDAAQEALEMIEVAGNIDYVQIKLSTEKSVCPC